MGERFSTAFIFAPAITLRMVFLNILSLIMHSHTLHKFTHRQLPSVPRAGRLRNSNLRLSKHEESNKLCSTSTFDSRSYSFSPLRVSVKEEATAGRFAREASLGSCAGGERGLCSGKLTSP